MGVLKTKKPLAVTSGNEQIEDKSNAVQVLIIPHSTKVQLDLDDIVSQLSCFASNGLLNLVAIHPMEARPVEAITVDCSMAGYMDKCFSFIRERNAIGFNIYFTVNKLKSAINNKPSKMDIESVTILHVDVDPAPSDIAKYGIKGATKKLIDSVSSIVASYAPSLVISSGNGIQIFWKLSTLLPVEEGEDLNKQLIILFGGDKGTHNADRIMRVAGTVNYPSNQKLAKGYSTEPVQAKILHIGKTATYDASRFPELATALVEEIPLQLKSIVPTTNAPTVAIADPDVLRAAFETFLSKPSNNSLSLFLISWHVPEEGYSEMFMRLLNHMAFFSQKDAALMMHWLLESPFGQSDWLQTRLTRNDKRIDLEIQKAIDSQHNVYDPNYKSDSTSTSSLSHDELSNDLGNRYFYENTRYVAKLGAWFIWDGIRWVRDERVKHLSLITDYMRTKSQELLTWAEDQKGAMSDSDFVKLMRGVRAEIKVLKSAPIRINIESMIKTDPKCSISPDIFDNDTRTIGTPAGTIDLTTGMLRPPTRSDYITKSTGCGLEVGIPVVWLKFLNEIFDGDQELISFMQRLFGYVLTGLTVEEKLFFFYGTGANGKSKLLETIYFILADYAKRAPASLLLEQRNAQHPTAMAGLMGARGVFASEIPSGKTWDDQVIKDLTGGDTVTARLMRQDFFEFIPQFSVLIAGNHQPRLKNVDESVIRRMVMIPFNVTISPEQRDTQLGEKLKAEAGQILGWCVEGAVEYFKNGLQIPESVANASREYIKNEDVIGDFIDSNMERDANNCEVRAIFELYKLWITSQGYNYPITERQLRKEFKDRGYEVKRSNSVYYIHNMKRKF